MPTGVAGMKCVKSRTGVCASPQLTLSPPALGTRHRGTAAHAFGTQRMTSCYLSPVEILLCASTEAEHGGTESGVRMSLFKEAEF